MDTNHNRQTTHYQSYLLRLWQENPAAKWRILLKEINTDEHYAFADMESLVQFLNEQVAIDTEIQIEVDNRPQTARAPPSQVA